MRLSQEAPEERQEAEKPIEQSLGRMARRERWPPRDDEDVPTPSLAKTEAEEKKARTDTMLVDIDPDRISFVRVTE